VLRLARVIGLGRAKELALLNDDVSPEDARAMGLVNWVCGPGEVEATLDRVIAKVRSAAPTATAHTKRLLHESFHRDPRAMIEAVVGSQNACMATWETAEANRAWREKRPADYHGGR
jgi:isohexenylglutaconyl-CoA hydratase